MTNLKYYLLFIIVLFFTSCVSIVRGVFGNKIMDSNYNPLQQEQIYFVETPYTIEEGLVVIKVRINNSLLESLAHIVWWRAGIERSI